MKIEKLSRNEIIKRAEKQKLLELCSKCLYYKNEKCQIKNKEGKFISNKAQDQIPQCEVIDYHSRTSFFLKLGFGENAAMDNAYHSIINNINWKELTTKYIELD